MSANEMNDQSVPEENSAFSDSEFIRDNGYELDSGLNENTLNSYQHIDNDKLEDSDSGYDASSTVQPREDEPLTQVDKLIIECRMRRSVSLDLSRSELQTLPDAVLRLEHVEYLYLEGNDISNLPEEFFKYFPRLKWLDLRRNHLVSLPSLHLGSHKCLRTLLLEENELQTLPLELGLVRTLDGLNLRNNFIEFPPEEIIAKGTKKILIFLRRMLKAKGGDQSDYVPENLRTNNLTNNNVMSTANSDLSSNEDDQDSAGQSSSAKKSTDKAKFRRPRSVPTAPVATNHGVRVKESTGETYSNPNSGLQCLSFTQMSKRIEKKYLSQTEKYVKPIDEVITEEKIQAKYGEEKRLARLRHRKVKQDEIIQGRKNVEIVKNFREETKRLQAKKLAERRLNGGFIEFAEPVASAPFGVVPADFKMISNAERIEQKASNEKKQELRPLSPETLMRLEEQRTNKERMLREKIREHALAMQSRRQKPYGNPLEDMKAAQRELEQALQLQREVEKRRRDLEYRFTAHTVDAIDSVGLPAGRLGSLGDRK